ncbi:uncharacterized protein [Primulina huaijiensis]|uniref:uncharacterized protein n=1 Tax=Primulina huaijiensis TaxID=1492673 RepID=UPI003CC73A2E
MVGILCKLMVFNCMNVTVLPKCYILRRWARNVINRVNSDFQESGNGGGSGGHVSEMVFVNQVMRSIYDLTQLSKSHEDARKILCRLVENAKDEISELVSKLSVDDEKPCDDIRSDGVCICNPLTAKAKGVTNANITRHWDTKSKKGKGKGKGKAQISSAKETKIKRQNSHYTSTSPQFPSLFGHNHHYFQVFNQVFGGPHSSQLWGSSYQFEGPHSSQGHDHGN